MNPSPLNELLCLSAAPHRETRGRAYTQREKSKQHSVHWLEEPVYRDKLLYVDVPIEVNEVKHEYFLPELRYSTDYKPQKNSFFVPAENESMRIMFHSCNGFSVGTDEDAWSGACLWNDVMRKHEAAPYHVMLGGGDQIYNDGIRVNGPLRPWTDIHNPQKRRDYPFPEKLRAECDDYYLKNYIRWYNTEPFSTANGQIPQLNIWDDHDVRILLDCLDFASSDSD